MRNSLRLSVVIFLMTFVTKLCGQGNDTLSIRFDENEKVSFARFSPGYIAGRELANGSEFLKSALEASQSDEFRLSRSRKDRSGKTHNVYQQYYKGLKVEGAVYMLHGRNSVETMNGNYAEIGSISVSPPVTAQTALGHAVKYIGAQKYNWEDPSMEQHIKRSTGEQEASYYPEGELVICKDILKTGKEWRLAWKFTISALKPVSSNNVFVDAISGEIINLESLIADANSAGTAETKYSGTRDITSDSFSSMYRLRESRNGVQIQTLNMEEGTNFANAVDFVDNDNDWTAAEHDNADEDQVALDAHWAAEIVLDYWDEVHNRNSIDDDGLTVKSYVHFDQNWNNAGWHSTQLAMVYGDGSTFDPLTALDVAGHEFGHGIDQFESNLTYALESGALDEGFADIWGATIEFWAAPEKDHWLIGEEIGGPLRSMSNPNLYGQPDTV